MEFTVAIPNFVLQYSSIELLGGLISSLLFCKYILVPWLKQDKKQSLEKVE